MRDRLGVLWVRREVELGLLRGVGRLGDGGICGWECMMVEEAIAKTRFIWPAVKLAIHREGQRGHHVAKHGGGAVRRVFAKLLNGRIVVLGEQERSLGQ
jgi:hypothetical protein